MARFAQNCRLLHMFHTGLGFDRLWIVYWVGFNADCVLVHMETRYLTNVIGPFIISAVRNEQIVTQNLDECQCTCEDFM